MYKDVIGIVGGMGSYATCDFFYKLINAFPAHKEWERPRIIIDNNCTMPSRVRAIMYREERPRLINELANSIYNLAKMGCTKVILACNTSHVFLPEVKDNLKKRNLGEGQPEILDIIENCGFMLKEKKITNVALLATEGTIISQIYLNSFKKYGILVSYPKQDKFEELRYLIECVKQNRVTDQTGIRFIRIVAEMNCKDVVLGCTEFPLIIQKIDRSSLKGINLHDPLIYIIDYLKKVLK